MSMASSLQEETPCSSDVAACNLPASVMTPGADNRNSIQSSDKFDKFLVIKHQDQNKNMAKQSPFKVDRAIKSLLGDNHKCRIESNFRSGLLLIEVVQKEYHDKLLRTNDLNGIPVIIEPHKTLNTSKGTIVCDALDEYTNDELKTELADYDVKEVYRTNKYTNGKQVPSNFYIITFNKPTIPQEVRIVFLNIKVSPYIPNPRRCDNCQRYGHGRLHCKRDPVCAKCGKTDPGHVYGECTDDKYCANCNGDHPASSRQCPLWQLEKETAKRKVTCNIRYPEAKAQVIFEHPDLASKIPHLRPKLQQKTYSSAARTPSATEQVQHQQHQVLEQLRQQIAHMQTQIELLTDIVKGHFLNTNINKTPNLSASESAKRARGDSSSSEENIPQPKQKPKTTSGGQEVTNMSAPPLPSDTSIGGTEGAGSSLPIRDVKSTASLVSQTGEATPMDDKSAGDPSPPPRRVREPSKVRDPSAARDPSVDRRPTGGGKEPKTSNPRGGGRDRAPLNRNGPGPTKNNK